MAPSFTPKAFLAELSAENLAESLRRVARHAVAARPLATATDAGGHVLLPTCVRTLAMPCMRNAFAALIAIKAPLRDSYRKEAAMITGQSFTTAESAPTTSPLEEFPATDQVTVLMGAVLDNNVKAVAMLLAFKGIIWNQRGPCGRKPEQAAFDLGHVEAHAMLVAVREKAELEASLLASDTQEQFRL